MKTKIYSIVILLAMMLSIVVSSCKKETTNTNPTVSMVNVNPNTVLANGTVQVTVSASDPDGDALTYSYTVTGGAITGSGPSVSWKVPSTEGAHSVAVTVSDGKGGTAMGNGAVTVQPEAAYTPIFSSTSISIDPTLIDFLITCTSDDYRLIKCLVTYPGGLGTETYEGPLDMIIGQPIGFPNYFPRLSGTWTFRITGTILSGSHINESFVASTSVNVSGK